MRGWMARAIVTGSVAAGLLMAVLGTTAVIQGPSDTRGGETAAAGPGRATPAKPQTPPNVRPPVTPGSPLDRPRVDPGIASPYRSGSKDNGIVSPWEPGNVDRGITPTYPPPGTPHAPLPRSNPPITPPATGPNMPKVPGSG
ncbi:hypothetical protein [Alicyclobacillus macrosporangiidus]|uniref:Uncharacterized protein n=1 Tax=Alicyclobacillus macrosporangiidus TaxID=392015 RepID=A0A1I7IVL3_9BACL|nr:hypothetical protein [Alicyclobacillus macrosporangiidus]SFU76997.1 hypothetical protein SAMN05421543_107156 [Alicyclobacillus macrosporangiidus]